METVLTAVHTALWKASSAWQTESSCAGAFDRGFPFLGALRFRGLSQVGSPKAAPQKGYPPVLFYHANYLASSLEHTPGPPPFPGQSLDAPSPLRSLHMAGTFFALLIPLPAASTCRQDSSLLFSFLLHKAWSMALPPIRIPFSFSLLSCCNSFVTRMYSASLHSSGSAVTIPN